MNSKKGRGRRFLVFSPEKGVGKVSFRPGHQRTRMSSWFPGSDVLFHCTNSREYPRWLYLLFTELVISSFTATFTLFLSSWSSVGSGHLENWVTLLLPVKTTSVPGPRRSTFSSQESVSSTWHALYHLDYRFRETETLQCSTGSTQPCDVLYLGCDSTREFSGISWLFSCEVQMTF